MSKRQQLDKEIELLKKEKEKEELRIEVERLKKTRVKEETIIHRTMHRYEYDSSSPNYWEPPYKVIC